MALGAEDPELHRNLASLLGALDAAPDFLAVPHTPRGLRPERLGKYRIEAELGQGGAGIVYLGQDPDLDRPVAIKTLMHGGSRPGWGEKLRMEARTLASVVHPNVAQVYSIEEVEGNDGIDRAILTMEYVPGMTLAHRLRDGPLPLESCLDTARQIAAALEAAHARSVIHRDLKPQNIRITPEGWIKVLDFGLAYPPRGGQGLHVVARRLGRNPGLHEPRPVPGPTDRRPVGSLGPRIGPL